MLWFLPLLLSLIGFNALRQRWAIQRRGAQGERLVGQVLNRQCPAVLHDVILPTGRGGELTQIDHLALTSKGILVIETKHYRGAITGAVTAAQWEQRHKGQSARSFQNPLRQNYMHLKAVDALGLDIPIRGCVVFTHEAHFPHGVPEGVWTLEALEVDLAEWCADPVPVSLLVAWEALGRQTQQDAGTRRAHRRALRKRFGWDRNARIAGGAFALAILAVLGLWWVQRAQIDISPVRAKTTADSLSPAPLIMGPRSTARETTQPMPAHSKGVIEIAWTDPEAAQRESSECRLARAAVLASNTEENRRYRDRVCPLDSP
ncbi:MAG: NERD domain-containing protein [Chromatiaceae bacterium]|nr:NERD domain-containing protein [Chromatiaceae bacterium]